MKKIIDIRCDLGPLFGPMDQNLLLLEKSLNVDIVTKHDGMEISGSPKHVRRVMQIFLDYEKLVETGVVIADWDFGAMLSDLVKDPSLSLQAASVPQKKGGAGKAGVKAKNVSQQAYMNAIEMNDMTFGIGPAGTGKTYLAVAMAVSALMAKKVKRLVLVRPAVEAGEKLGFLPGTLQEKIDPYLRPLYDALYDMMSPEKVTAYMAKGTIEVAPLAFMRGRTIKDSFIIMDEAQNTSKEQMKMFLTRLGEGSKAVITGDVTQIDLPPQIKSGLVDAVAVLKDVEGIAMFQFDESDVVRHALVQRIVNAYANAAVPKAQAAHV